MNEDELKALDNVDVLDALQIAYHVMTLEQKNIVLPLYNEAGNHTGFLTVSDYIQESILKLSLSNEYNR